MNAAGQVAFDAASNFPVGAYLRTPLFHVLTSFLGMGHPGDRDHVQGPVTAAIQPVPDRVPGGRRDGIHPGEGGECCLVTDSVLV